MTFEDLRNQTDLQFTDISSELHRNYVYANGEALRVEQPVALHVDEDGAHRLFTADGESVYVAPGFRMIVWETKEGEPHFVK